MDSSVNIQGTIMALHEIQIPCTITITVDSNSKNDAVTNARKLLDEALGDANAAAQLMKIPASINAMDETTLPWVVNGVSMYVDSIA